MKTLGRHIRNNILVGLIIFTPLAVTAFIVVWLFNLLVRNRFVLFLSDALVRVFSESLRDNVYEQYIIQGIAVFLMLLSLFFVGFFVRSFIGKRLYALGEMLLGRIPVVNKIYIYVRQISEGFIAQRQSMFKEVVMVAYPRKGLYSLGFVTATAPAMMSKHVDEADGDGPIVTLFVPTTPNPTSGVMIMVPRRDVKILPITVADAMKFVVSAGAVHPEENLVDVRPTLLDKLEQWLAKDE